VVAFNALFQRAQHSAHWQSNVDLLIEASCVEKEMKNAYLKRCCSHPGEKTSVQKSQRFPRRSPEWIIRINAACRARGMRYSQFINGLNKSNVKLDRKSLSEIAICDPSGFDKIVETAKAAL